MADDVQTYGSFHSDGEGYRGRIEVVSGPTGRRRWPEHVKAAIVLETYRDGVTVAEVARRHEISGPQLHAWRRAARDGLLPMPHEEAPAFLPVSISEAAGDPPDEGPAPLTLEIGDIRIDVPPSFDTTHLGRVIAAVRGAS